MSEKSVRAAMTMLGVSPLMLQFIRLLADDEDNEYFLIENGTVVMRRITPPPSHASVRLAALELWSDVVVPRHLGGIGRHWKQ